MREQVAIHVDPEDLEAVERIRRAQTTAWRTPTRAETFRELLKRGIRAAAAEVEAPAKPGTRHRR